LTRKLKNLRNTNFPKISQKKRIFCKSFQKAWNLSKCTESEKEESLGRKANFLGGPTDFFFLNRFSSVNQEKKLEAHEVQEIFFANIFCV
jgi:hypothetical protein